MFHEACALAETASLILDGLPMGVLFCDSAGVIRFVNKAYASLLGKSPAEILGQNIISVIPHSRAMLVMRAGKPELGELCQLGPGVAPVIVNRLPVRDRDGQIAGMISQALFNDPEELRNLSIKIDQLGRKLTHYQRRFEAGMAAQYTFASILGESEATRRLKRQAQSYARLDESVLILGATGSGKELFAHAMHAASPRARGPMVCINCAAIPKDLFESELFGYARGAFSGARREGKIGQIELADNGTLFLDEIGEMPAEIQAKLLRVLESRAVFRLGAVNGREIDFRLIAATNRNIGAMLKSGAFREDLYYRINTFTLEIPPLEERKDDILPIAEHILARMGLENARFSQETRNAMREFSWPGNARQLHNAVVHAATMRKGDEIRVDDFPPETLPSLVERSEAARLGAGELANLRSAAEAKAIREALRERRGNVAAAARSLKIGRATLYEKMRKYGIQPREERKPF